MSYVEQWNAISGRIRALAKTGELYALLHTNDNSDTYSIWRHIGRHCDDIISDLTHFRRDYKEILPPGGYRCLSTFLEGRREVEIRKNTDQRMTLAGLTLIIALETEMSYLLHGRQEALRARSERAFLHLQRLLAVDDEVRKKWELNLRKGEVECERLGAVHLLWHGIFAYKIDAIGARTDLVFNERLAETYSERGVEGLVLTEWKISDEKSGAKRSREARHQAERYQSGPLLGTELTGYRYAVVVSLNELPRADIPDDFPMGDVVYRHVNIALNPRTPSKFSRQEGSRG
jgi:hypothetical protein